MAITTQTLAGYNVGTAFFDVLNVGFTAKTLIDERKNGASIPVATAKAASSFLYGEAVMPSINKYISSKVGGAVKGVIGFKAKQGGIRSITSSVLGTAASWAIVLGGEATAQAYGAYAENTSRIMAGAYAQRGRFGSGHFEMTEAGYTMRQRSLNAIRQNGLNTQSVLGNEARTYYRGNV